MHVAFELDTVIRRPAEAVFAFVTDPANLPRWDPRVVEVAVDGGGPLREGTRMVEVRRAGPKRLEQVVEVARLDPPRAFGLRIVEGPFPVHGDLEFRPEAAGSTRVVLRAHGDVRGPQVLAPVVARLGRRQMRAQYDRLKRILEQDA